MYLIYQERIEEAASVFKQVSLEHIDAQIQYDYISAYLNFMTDYPDFTKAKEICSKYLAYPVLKWRNLFIEIANQMAEYEETELTSKLMDEKSRAKNVDKAKNTPHLKAEIAGSNIKCVCERLNSFTIKYYRVDLEILFSQNPFRESLDKNFSHIFPFHQDKIKLDGQELLVREVPIPQNISNQNLFIQIIFFEDFVSKSIYLEYIPFSLDVHVNEEFGVLKLVDPRKMRPVPKVYVKCFALFKDGK